MRQNLRRPARFLFLNLLAGCVVVATAAPACVKLPRRPPAAVVRADTHAPTGETSAGPRLNLNTATARELERLPGVGPALAARVVEHRARYGPFRRAEHLMAVRGISERRFRALRAHVTAE